MEIRPLKPKLIIVGNGGHAKEVINVLLANNEFEIIGCTGTKIENRDNNSHINSVINVPILGEDSILPQLLIEGVEYAFIAIGDNALRAKLYDHVKKIGFHFANAISTLSSFFTPTQIGDNVLIMPGCLISASTQVGNNVIIGANSYLGHDGVIEDHAHIAPHSAIAGNVHIEAGAFLGIGSRVIPKKRVGAWSIIGAGATVISDIPNQTTVVGTPAKLIKKKITFYQPMS